MMERCGSFRFFSIFALDKYGLCHILAEYLLTFASVNGHAII